MNVFLAHVILLDKTEGENPRLLKVIAFNFYGILFTPTLLPTLQMEEIISFMNAPSLNARGHSLTTLARFWLFLTTYIDISTLGTIHLRRRQVLGGEGCLPLPMFADARGGGF